MFAVFTVNTQGDLGPLYIYENEGNAFAKGVSILEKLFANHPNSKDELDWCKSELEECGSTQIFGVTVYMGMSEN